MNILSGKITYLAAFGLLCLGVVDIVNGDTAAGTQKIVEAMGLAGLRRGVARSGK